MKKKQQPIEGEKELFVKFCIYSNYQNSKNKRWVWRSKGSPKEVQRWFRAVLYNKLAKARQEGREEAIEEIKEYIETILVPYEIPINGGHQISTQKILDFLVKKLHGNLTLLGLKTYFKNGGTIPKKRTIQDLINYKK